MTDLAASIAAIQDSVSMVPDAPVEGRVLLVDGDALAYACAGSDDTPPGAARQDMLDRLASAKRASGATSCVILLTAQTSHKGHRYVVARVKPYQGTRASHRPKNWQFLRQHLERGGLAAEHAEADDLFGAAVAERGWEHCVVYSPDKDLRMVPGLHLHWSEHRMLRVPEGAFEVLDQDGKVYGEKAFWLQMLQGDSADNIPGLPAYVADGKQRKVGPVTAAGFLKGATCGWDALCTVRDLYRSLYGAEADVQMAEQGVLLWMRRDPASHWWDVFREGCPLAPLAHCVMPLLERVEAARCA